MEWTRRTQSLDHSRSPSLTASSPPAEPRLSGTVLLDQMAVISEAYGKSVLARAKTTLPVDRQQALDALLPVSWIDTRAAMELKNAVARDVGMDPIEFQRW